ncbi:thioesterase family protein [Streptomonospora wellingtoniae]|uniref:Thioesterase family protein n=1 Tax=Streptomonospora wellingtoniae TaxID=3075544 RepID=A0ABU2KRZ4_9ACTN|nr:thioesterase family protein [Streptomonospora sp. DSM 45055]MDT0302059.1 thioesterase family protein [Streptomonospora sp. DSM 45055]
MTAAPAQDGGGYAAVLRQRVAPEWIDYNGHLSEAYYVLIFGFATDGLMEGVGLGPDYRRATGRSLYTVEAHVRYLREVGEGREVEIRTRVVAVGAKKVRLCHEMWLEGDLRATEELMALHVDQETQSTVPFPEAVAGRLSAVAGEAPDYAGRAIG